MGDNPEFKQIGLTEHSRYLPDHRHKGRRNMFSQGTLYRGRPQKGGGC